MFGCRSDQQSAVRNCGIAHRGLLIRRDYFLTQWPLLPPLFSSSLIGPNDIPLSTALHMSYSVRDATAAAVMASISTPVSAFVVAVDSIRAPLSIISIETSRCVSASGWQSGINSDVFFPP